MKQKVVSQSAIGWIYWIISPTLLAAITWLVYWPSLHYEFQFDDIANIVKHFQIRHHTFTKLLFSSPRWISYWMNALHYHYFKFDPFSYRVGNVVIHILTGMILFFILMLLLRRYKYSSFFSHNAFSIAGLTSLLFLLHPVQTQTVTYVIQGQLEGLSTLFVLATMLCFILFCRVQHIFLKLFFVLATFGLAALSTGTKEIAIVGPALLLLVDWFLIAQGDWKQLQKRLWVHATLFTIVIGLYVYLLKPSFFTQLFGLKMSVKNNVGNIITESAQESIKPLPFFISQFKVILHYLLIFVFPFFISVEYDWKLCSGFFAPDCLFPFLLLVALGVGVSMLLKKNRAHLIAFAALWTFICLLPRSSIIPSPELLVDYKTYMASCGILFVIATTLVWFVRTMVHEKKMLQKAHVCLPVILLIPLSYLTYERNKVWSSGLNFWGDVIKNAPSKARAYNNYGVELSQKLYRFEESVPYFKKAIAIDNNYADPCNNLAVAYGQINKLDLAIDAMIQGLRLNPYYPEGYNNLASFYIEKKEFDKARASLENALKLRPHYGKAWYNMGRMHLLQGDEQKAWQYFKKCCTEADLDNEHGFLIYAQSSIKLQKYKDAIFAYQKVIECNPAHFDGYLGLANAYQLDGQYDKAIELYGHLRQQNPSDFRLTFNLAEAYLKARKFDKALFYFQSIYHLRSQMPPIAFRMAACYEQLGKPQQACKELEAALRFNYPQEVKNQMNQLREQMIQRYHLV